MNKFDLDGKNIIIAGASSGIGYRTAVICAEAGARVILFGRRLELLEKCAQECPDPAAVLPVKVDLTDDKALEQAVADAALKAGKFHGLVYSAGSKASAATRSVKCLASEDLLSDYRINVAAGLKLAGTISLKKYVAEEGASFVFISSVNAHTGTPGISSYSATKGALLSAARSLAAELAGRHIRVNTVSPGYVPGTGLTQTSFVQMTPDIRKRIIDNHPLGMGTTDNIALPIRFLLSDASSWITGADLIIDGGYMLRNR